MIKFRNIQESHCHDDEMTDYGFISHMEAYIKQLLFNPIKAQPDSYLKSHNIDGPKALKMLLKRQNPSDENSAILIRTTKIRPKELEEGEDTSKTPKDVYCVKYRLPKKDYYSKMKNLYKEIQNENSLKESMNANRFPELSKVTKKDEKDNQFTMSFGKNGLGLTDELKKIGKEIENISKNNNVYLKDCFIDTTDDVYDLTFEMKPIDKKKEAKEYAKYQKIHDKKHINEDGEGGTMADMGGATNASQSGQFVQPLFKPIKRKTIYISEEQKEYIKKKLLDEECPAVSDSSAGEFGYDAPALVKPGDETLDHQNMMAKSWTDGK